MFKKAYFDKAVSRDQIIETMKKDGFKPELVTDKPNFVYKPHQHKEIKLIICLEGSMRVTVEGKTYDFEPGDKLKILGNTLHSGIVGDKGCIYYWSEKVS